MGCRLIEFASGWLKIDRYPRYTEQYAVLEYQSNTLLILLLLVIFSRVQYTISLKVFFLLHIQISNHAIIGVAIFLTRSFKNPVKSFEICDLGHTFQQRFWCN